LQKKSFIKGALILSAAGILSKILGAVYRIPFARIVEGEGLGIYQMAYPFYTLILAVSTAGIPLAVSKLISERECQGDYDGVRKVFRLSLIALTAFGILASGLLFLSADWISINILKEPRAALSLKAIAPAILFTSVIANFRGFFQGHQRMTPTAISQVLEQFVRVGTVFIATWFLLDKGLELTAAGASFGASTGSFAALVVIILIYMFSRERKEKSQVCNEEKSGDLFKKIVQLAIPITIGALVLPLMQIMDTFLVPGTLQKAGVEAARATDLFGQLSGMAGSIINLPFMVTTSLAASLVPSISEKIKLGLEKEVQTLLSSGFKLAAVIVLPATAGLMVLSEPIMTMLFKEPEAGSALLWMAPTVLAIGAYQVASGTLQGYGKVMVPVISLVSGVTIKAVLTYVLIIKGMGIEGAALATVIGYLAAAGINIHIMNKFTGKSWFSFQEHLTKPFSAVVMMSVAAIFFHRIFMFAGNSLATLASISLAGVVYLLVLVKIKGIKEEEIQQMPKFGEKLVKIGKKVKLL
jgi:stage V sporulation protein B